MPFHFNLQKILNYRMQLEEEAKVRLAQVQQMYIKEEQRFEELQAQLAEKEPSLYRNFDMEAGERWLLENYVKGLRADMAATQLRLRNLHQMVEQARTFLLERAKDRKALEKLKEKQELRYREEERQKELKTNDETATLRFKAAAF